MAPSLPRSQHMSEWAGSTCCFAWCTTWRARRASNYAPSIKGKGCALCATQALLEQASWQCAAMYAANRGAVGRAHKSRPSLILSGSTIIGCKTGCPMKAYCLHAAAKTGNLILSALSRHVH